MAQGSTSHELDPRLVTRIVGSYERRHKIGVGQLAGLIAEADGTLAGLGRVESPREGRVPAVRVRRSVHRDYVICFDC